MENLSLVSVRLPRDLVEKIDLKVYKDGRFLKSDFIRAACNLLLIAESNHTLYQDICDLSQRIPERKYHLESV